MPRATKNQGEQPADWLRRNAARVVMPNGDDVTDQFEQVLSASVRGKRRQVSCVPEADRCRALCEGASAPRCSRRRRPGEQFCGTHMKGQPHGVVAGSSGTGEVRHAVVIEEVKGIPYYVDAEVPEPDAPRRAYDPAAVLDGRHNPSVVGLVRASREGPVFVPANR